MLAEVLPALDALPKHLPWTFGGGTALALALQHRVSHDIDVFFKSVEAIELLSPAINPSTRAISKGHREHGHFLKLTRDDGEIDFIVARSVTADPSRAHWMLGHCISVETPGEIIAKKVAYRGTHLRLRDVFDIAALAEQNPSELAKVAVVAPEKLRVARDRAELIATTWKDDAPSSITPLPAGMKLMKHGAEICVQAFDKLISSTETRQRER